MKTAILQANYDSRNSFYGKATLVFDGTKVHLKSYETIVATYNKRNNTMKVHDWFSSTTARHINEFLLQNGFGCMVKKEMLKKPLIQK